MYRKTLGEDLVQIEFPGCDGRIGRNVEDHCKRFPNWLFVCEEEGEIVGFVTFLLKPEKSLGILDDNAVDPKYQSKGIATMMYRAVLQYMSDHGIKYAKVLTGLDEAHAPARRAYEKAGFHIRHEDVTYYTDLQNYAQAKGAAIPSGEGVHISGGAENPAASGDPRLISNSRSA
jgi:ribosomal protein S18 acetylase RimI-like enzyme